METHFTNEQMDELLRFVVNDDAAGSQDLLRQTDVHAHLNSCPECRSWFQAEEAYLKELRALRIPGSGNKREDCPSEEIWLQLAGNCVEQDSALYLDHASHCDYCSRLLREAMEDMQGPIDGDERKQLAELERRADTWPIRAQALFQRANASERVGPDHASGKRPTVLTYLARHRITLGGAVFACLGLGLLYKHSLDLAQQVRDSRAEISRLQSDLQRQEQKTADSSSLAGLSAMSVVKLPLTPGLTRSGGVVTRLELPAGTKYVEVALGPVGVRVGVARAVLSTFDGQRRWSNDFAVSPADVRDRHVSFVVPADSLPPNDYEVVLSQDSPNGKQELAESSFRVIPNHP